MAAQRRLMAVHAHPDDEASSTGGILAKYAAEGARTIVVTCTNGELGDDPAGKKPTDSDHDLSSTIAMRRQELEESCRILNVSHLELLGFHDSGMMGWPNNESPGSFWSKPVEEAALPLVDLLHKYEPQVVVTYDDNGFYGHPDHIQAHRITVEALEKSAVPARLFCPTIRRSAIADFSTRLEAAGVEPPDFDEEEFGSPDEDIAASIDCRSFASAKRAALQAHSSQTDNSFFLDLPPDFFVEAFGREEFLWWSGRDGTPTPMHDLFEGVPAN